MRAVLIIISIMLVALSGEASASVLRGGFKDLAKACQNRIVEADKQQCLREKFGEWKPDYSVEVRVPKFTADLQECKNYGVDSIFPEDGTVWKSINGRYEGDEVVYSFPLVGYEDVFSLTSGVENLIKNISESLGLAHAKSYSKLAEGRYWKALEDHDFNYVVDHMSEIKAFLGKNKEVNDFGLGCSYPVGAYLASLGVKNTDAAVMLLKGVDEDIAYVSDMINRGVISDVDYTVKFYDPIKSSLAKLKDTDLIMLGQASKALLRSQSVLVENANKLARLYRKDEAFLSQAQEVSELVLLARKLKATNWKVGLGVLGQTEYFDDKYLGYIFKVSGDDDYSVVQSSGSVARLESLSGGPVIIVSFKGFPSPIEGASLSGRYLRLDRIGTYRTSLGAIRNAYFMSVVK